MRAARTTRAERLTSAAIAAACLVAPLFGSCARPERGLGGVARAGAIAALPRESVVLLIVEVARLRKVNPEARWLEEAASDPQLEGPLRVVRDCYGEDVLDRLERLALAIVPRPEHHVSYGVVAQGAFSRTGAATASCRDEILSLSGEAGPPDLNLAGLPDGAMAIGPRAVLEIIRDNVAHPGAGLGGNPLLLAPIDRLPAGAHLWGAIDYQTLSRLARDAAQSRGTTVPALPGSEAADALVSVGFHGRVDEDFDFGLLGQARGDAEARSLSDTARVFLALARAGLDDQRQAEWLAILDSLSVENRGIDIVVQGRVTRKTLDVVAGKLRAAAGGGMGQVSTGLATPGAPAPRPGTPAGGAVPGPATGPVR